MRIGEINSYNYTEFLRPFSITSPRVKKLSQLLTDMPQFMSQAQSCTLGPPGVGEDVTGRTDWKKIVPVPKEVTDKLLAKIVYPAADGTGHYPAAGRMAEKAAAGSGKIITVVSGVPKGAPFFISIRMEETA